MGAVYVVEPDGEWRVKELLEGKDGFQPGPALNLVGYLSRTARSA
jgi:hypothetical protein